MKKFLLISSVILGLAACSSDRTPTPLKLSHNVQEIPPQTVISVISRTDFPAPREDQAAIVKMGTFKAYDNVYDPNGSKILIHRNSIISGTYRNNGVMCEVTWEAVYANKTEYEEKRGSTVLRDITYVSHCDPLRGIQKGDRATIRFKSNIAE